jgi:hypothetical protein
VPIDCEPVLHLVVMRDQVGELVGRPAVARLRGNLAGKRLMVPLMGHARVQQAIALMDIGPFPSPAIDHALERRAHRRLAR